MVASLRQYQAIAERHRHSGAAEVDYVVLRDAANEIERLRDQVAMLSDPQRLAESLTEFVRQQADSPRHSEAKLDALIEMVRRT